MSEEQQAGNEPQFLIQRIYTKDLSFESPNAPQVFVENWTPEVNVGIKTDIQTVGEDTYEVVLTVTVEARHEDHTIYLVEVHQAGIFLARNIPDEQLRPLLGIGGPNALLPYVREIISDLTTRGTFPPFLLQPVNFEAMYAQQMAQEQGTTESAPESQPH
ncbi:MAG: protein-export chaperone SecB [Gammaproteobacteria bacterium]|nr:MAG: protein-export chaperone SecB [Gammaproteobacteria bacterium]